MSGLWKLVSPLIRYGSFGSPNLKREILFSKGALSTATSLHNLQMTLTIWSSTKTRLHRSLTKTEKYFFNIKLISVASTQKKVKFQASNSFDIASVYSTYLNIRHIFLCLTVKSLACLFSLAPPIIQFWPFKVAPHDAWTSVPSSKLNLTWRPAWRPWRLTLPK